jgi:hypothetical protein
MNTLFASRRLFAAAPIWLLAGMVLAAAPGRAGEPPPKRHRMENRFLFVVDTSAAMRLRTNGIEQAVAGLIESGMNGELRQDDTIGLWRYSDRLWTDFPMLVWSEKNKDDLAEQARGCLRHARYEKRSRLDKVMPALRQVMADSERLTVIFVFDGSGLITGTPFDKHINALHKKYARQFRAAHEPFVTLLAARGGAVFDYTINYPNSVIVPHTADPLPPPETNAPPPVVAATPLPPAPTNLRVEPEPPPRRTEIIMSGTNLITHDAGAASPAASNVVAVAPATPAPIAPPPPAPAPAPAPATPTPAPAPVINAAPPSTPAPVAVQITNTSAALVVPPRTPPPAPPVVTPAPPPPAAIPASKPVPVRPAPVPAPVAGASTAQQVAMFVIAFSLLTIAVVLVLFLVRRSRGAPQPSLISQSIDRSR